MHRESKARIVARNTAMGIVNNLALAVLSLISRKLFLNYIGIEYLSIGQVINNILGVLAFSEFGVANSVLYMLYKPVAANDHEKIARIIGTYKRINRLIGSTILVLGIVCLPFLDRFIHTSIPNGTVYLIFTLNLLSSVSTYFCSYRQVLINANQANYVISEVMLVINFAGIAVQCAVIYLTHNYIAYLVVMIVMGLVQNLILYEKAGKMFPFLREYKSYRLVKNEAKELLKNVQAMFSVKICGIVINNTDNILVSMINTLLVGYCANYTIISIKLKSLITIFHNSVVYSLGIASVDRDASKKYRLFKCFQLINFGIAGFSATLLGFLWDDFIVLWIGREFLIPKLVMYSILLNFYWTVVTSGIWIFRDTNGLFVYVKKVLIINAILNLVISVALGKVIGVAGVYFATLIADILTNFWYDAKLVYTRLFGRSNAREYIISILIQCGITMIIVIILKFVFRPLQVTILNFAVKGVVAACIYVVIFLLINGRSSAFREVLQNYIIPKLKKEKNSYE